MCNIVMTSGQSIYESLADEKSRQIFLLRKRFAMAEQVDFGAVFDGRPFKRINELIKKIGSKSYCCYGAGEGCRVLLGILKSHGLLGNCLKIYDSNISLSGKMIEGIPVAGFGEKAAERAELGIMTPYSYSVTDNMEKMLLAMGIPPEKTLKFSDYYAINDIEMYFDPLIIKEFGGKEIFVDGGCLDFKTSINFLRHCPNAHKIYAFEPNGEQVAVINQNIGRTGFQNVRVIEAALWDHNTELSFAVTDYKSGGKISTAGENTISAFSLDSIVEADEEITFIKLDVEGAELNALKGASETIKKYKPKLAISVYHKPMDFIDISGYLKSLVPDYELFFRHYTTFDSETVLYCR
ncbi:MAG: FkbM family methyltransferase [Lachnospiraceae bacterium]|nr:FkbM family methyltransferase [Lachnospiraceae bacterium]